MEKEKTEGTAGSLDPANELAVQTLMQHYAALRAEVLLQITSIKNHTNYSQAFLVAAGSAIAWLWTQELFKVEIDNAFLWLMIITIAISVAHYFVYSVMESVLTMSFLGSYLASLEKKVNSLVRTDVLIWESRIAPRIVDFPFPLKGVLSPHMMMAVPPFVTITLLAVIFPLIVCYDIWKISSNYSLLQICTVLVVTYCAVLTSLTMCTAYGTYHRCRSKEDGLPNLVEEAWAAKQDG
jgi:hypothetical protein